MISLVRAWIHSFQGGDYEEGRFLGFGAVWALLEQ
jgi:hypothetical protein